MHLFLHLFMSVLPTQAVPANHMALWSDACLSREHDQSHDSYGLDENTEGIERTITIAKEKSCDSSKNDSRGLR